MTHRPAGGGPPRPFEPLRSVRPHPADAPGDRPRDGAPPEPGTVDPAVLTALLHRHGWRRRGGAPGRYGRWTPPGPAAGGASLLVPVSRAFPDSDDLLGEALLALSRSGTPAAREILLSLAVPSDEIRWERDMPTGPGATATWTAEEQLRAAARRMLLAGALATRARAGYYGARHRRAAETALESVLVGPAPDGRHLAAFLPVGTGRPLAVRLHQALYAAREAVDYRRATGGAEAFDSAVAAGVSHELTESLVALVRGTEGARIAVGWAPAAGVPEGCGTLTEPVEFSPGDLPALREAAARYLRAEPSVPVRITGTVDRMRRPGPRGPGTVRLRVLAGAEVPHVRVALDEEAYRIAGHAHLVGLPVRMLGRLESRGGFRRLTGACEITPVQVDDAERDRLLKAVQEHVEVAAFFEEACGDGGDCRG
ncbi:MULTISPECIES: hypothetical protein [Streptomyces]|uniref:Uncharacterized protein n=5 Tax=Streptomyces TaxID=1883 RepID=A0ACD4WVT5_STRVN|nr:MULTISPECIES: hypothetical protein [Streptomyces]QSJ12515.1 hypothetical protein SLIVDG2_30115 [Streptomyces lividans]AIJ16915.1 hypothetical protein SLIV_30115 [Streptomyces lividans TK24]KKD12412.1 hypothetical protein TR66_26165 [Streptomyces sp. WM6391]MBQ0950647.1 hypothetical protein [Streptomyces sp. RK76]MCW8117444.1 hypothetical protein [Streptomyces anthocyanicus]